MKAPLSSEMVVTFSVETFECDVYLQRFESDFSLKKALYKSKLLLLLLLSIARKMLLG